MEQRKDPRKVLEQTYCPRLDKLYTSAVRCPYCRNKIQKLQTTCSKCGLNKIQIAYASNKRAKQMMKSGERGKIVMMRRRPNDVKLYAILLRAIFGLFGMHNFYVGRKIRGWISFGFMFVFIVTGIIIFELDLTEFTPVVAALSTPAIVIWVTDIFGIIFGWYKYPVRLGEAQSVGEVKSA
jgi:hypothetical protein